MRRRGIGGLAIALGASLALAPAAQAELPHVVQPGETLWSISAANNLTTRTVAVYNGLAEDAYLIEGSTIMVPTVEEGAAALAAGAPVSSPPPVAGASTETADPAPAPAEPASDPSVTETIVSAPGMGHVPSPWGELHLDPVAAERWNAMREEALAVYGVDIYPNGPVSAYRTYEQQAALYEMYLNGTGEPANPPGTSSHEIGTAVDVATPEMRSVVDEIGWKYGWTKIHGPSEWWHVDFGG